MAQYAEVTAARRASEPTSVVWGILCSITALITSTIPTVVMRLQGHHLRLSQQASILHRLIVDLMLAIDMERQIGWFPDLDASRIDCEA